MSSSDVRKYGLHGEVPGDDHSGSSDVRSAQRDVHPEPPADIPTTRHSGSFASSGPSSDAGRGRQDQEAAWRAQSWGDHDSWGVSGLVTQTGPGDNGDGPGENRMMAVATAIDIIDRDQNVAPTYTMHRQIGKLPRQMGETEFRGGAILQAIAEQVETVARMSRPPRPRRSLMTLGWRRSAGKHPQASRRLSGTRKKATPGSLKLGKLCGKDGSTLTTLVEVIGKQSARRRAQEVGADPLKGSLSRPSTEKTLAMTSGLRRDPTFDRSKLGGG